MPEPDELSEETIARQQALRPLLADVEIISRSFDDFAPAHIYVSVGQYANAIVSADLSARVLRSLHLGRRLSGLDFSNAAAIGGTTRRVISESIDEVASLRNATERLAWFIAPSPFDRLRELLLAMGKHGSELVESLLRVVTADSVARAASAMHETQRLYGHPHYVDELCELLDLAPEFAVEDVDARISLALGIAGSFTDELGIPDAAKIFSAVAGGADSFGRVGHATAQFLGHLLDTPIEQTGPEAACLVLNAIPLAVLDRPFHGHEIGHRLVELLRTSWTKDEVETRTLIQTTVSEGERLFAASLRVRRELKLALTE